MARKNHERALRQAAERAAEQAQEEAAKSDPAPDDEDTAAQRAIEAGVLPVDVVSPGVTQSVVITPLPEPVR